jgi:hypothetical protein
MTTPFRSVKNILLLTAGIVLGACNTDTASGPGARANTVSALASVLPELGPCPDLAPPAGSKLTFHVYAEGVQIYRWNGTSWTFVAPDAALYADAGGKGLVGTHYAGPTWESLSGSKVVGAVQKRCTADPDAIQWLLLGAVSQEGPGIFSRVDFIQRVNTTGGVAPTTNGTSVGQEAGVPYTTEYYFYRAPR